MCNLDEFGLIINNVSPLMYSLVAPNEYTEHKSLLKNMPIIK